jgi:hypothetical protein
MSNDGLWRWDGSQWIPAAPPLQPHFTFRAIRTRSRLAIVGLVLAGLAQLVMLGALVGRLDIVNRITAGSPVTLDEATRSDNVVRAGAFLILGGAVLGAVVFLVWLHRVVANNNALGARALRFSPGGAVGWWFCPVINWVRPFQIMTEAWRASDPQVPGSTPAQRAEQRRPLTLIFWYLFWLVGSLVAFFANFMRPSTVDAQTLDTLHSQTIAYLIASVLSTIAAVLAIMLVTRITDRQERLQVVVSAASPAPAPAPAPA